MANNKQVWKNSAAHRPSNVTKSKQLKITDFIPSYNNASTNNKTVQNTKTVAAIDLPCLQLNTQKRQISCEILNKYCKENNYFLLHRPGAKYP